MTTPRSASPPTSPTPSSPSSQRSHVRSASTPSPPPMSSSATTPSSSPPSSRRNSSSHSSDFSSAFDRYQIVDDICKESNFYRILGIKRTSSIEDIRRAYISKSRICHPDKLREYPKATEAFQKLSVAYETLSKPSSRRMYDLSGGLSRGGRGRPGGSEIGSDGEATLHAVLYQLFDEFMTNGDFDTIRSFILALNETTPGLNLSDDMIQNVEATFRKLRDISLVATKYIKLVKFELMKLYELQYKLRKLSYFDIFGRLALTIRIAKLILRIPIVINVASKSEGANAVEKELCYDDVAAGGQQGISPSGSGGIFGDRVEKMLRMMVAVLEAGEKWVVRP